MIKLGEIIDASTKGERGKYAFILEALKALPPGKALPVTFDSVAEAISFCANYSCRRRELRFARSGALVHISHRNGKAEA